MPKNTAAIRFDTVGAQIYQNFGTDTNTGWDIEKTSKIKRIEIKTI